MTTECYRFFFSNLNRFNYLLKDSIFSSREYSPPLRGNNSLDIPHPSVLYHFFFFFIAFTHLLLNFPNPYNRLFFLTQTRMQMFCILYI